MLTRLSVHPLFIGCAKLLNLYTILVCGIDTSLAWGGVANACLYSGQMWAKRACCRKKQSATATATATATRRRKLQKHPQLHRHLNRKKVPVSSSRLTATTSEQARTVLVVLLLEDKMGRSEPGVNKYLPSVHVRETRACFKTL